MNEVQNPIRELKQRNAELLVLLGKAESICDKLKQERHELFNKLQSTQHEQECLKEFAAFILGAVGASTREEAIKKIQLLAAKNYIERN